MAQLTQLLCYCLNQILQSKLAEAIRYHQRPQVIDQNRTRLDQQKIPHTRPPYSYPVDQYHAPLNSHTDECTRRTDEALRELEEMKQNMKPPTSEYTRRELDQKNQPSRNFPHQNTNNYTPQYDTNQVLPLLLLLLLFNKKHSLL